MLRRGAFTAKQLLVSWLKFLCEALGRSSLRSKLRASSLHWHGLSIILAALGRTRASSVLRSFAQDFEQNRVFDPLCIFDAQGVKRRFF